MCIITYRIGSTNIIFYDYFITIPKLHRRNDSDRRTIITLVSDKNNTSSNRTLQVNFVFYKRPTRYTRTISSKIIYHRQVIYHIETFKKSPTLIFLQTHRKTFNTFSIVGNRTIIISSNHICINDRVHKSKT